MKTSPVPSYQNVITSQEIKKFAEKQMGTKDVRIDTRLNKAIWAQVFETAKCKLLLNLLS